MTFQDRERARGALYDWDQLVEEERAHRLIYTDPAIFQLEMTHVFGGTWTYVAHESEVAKPNDFVTRRLGTRPVIVVRDGEGKVRVLFNRCTHRGTTLCRLEKGNARHFQCPYHGWNFANTGQLRGVPWPDGYAGDMRDPKYNVAQVPRVESYRGFVFCTLNMDALPLVEHLGPITQPIDDWVGRNPGGKLEVCEANRIKYKGNWKLAYDNSCDGYHVIYSHRSLIETEARLAEGSLDGRSGASPNATDLAGRSGASSNATDLAGRSGASPNAKGMSYYKNSPDSLAMYMRYTGHGNHFKDKRPNVENRPGGLWALEPATPGQEHYEQLFRQRYGDRAPALLDLAGSVPVNINVFPNFSLLGNHIQVFEPIGVGETNAVWYGTRVVDDGNIGADAVRDINALRMRTQEQFPNFGEVDDVANFEQIQKGLDCIEDEWVYMNRGHGIEGRVKVEADGTISAPATDEAFMREHFKEWKRLMKARPNNQVARVP